MKWAEMTFPVDPRLKGRAEEAAKNISHDLPLTVNDQVLPFLNFFQTPRGRAIVETGLRRAGRYREMISRVLQEEGLPQDLIYLAQAESAFQPLALSPRRRTRNMAIRGLPPARNMGFATPGGLRASQDPRKPRTPPRNIFATSTNFTVTGTWQWPLITAAPGNVQRASREPVTRTSGSFTNGTCFPRETKNYVPIIIALTLIAKDAAHYNIEAEPEAPVATDIVKPGRAIDLRLVAEPSTPMCRRFARSIPRCCASRLPMIPRLNCTCRRARRQISRGDR